MWRVPWLFPRIGPPIFPYSTILSVFGMTASLKLTVQPGVRYWMRETYGRGCFIGLHGVFSIYNAGGLFGHRYRYEGTAFGGGLSAGLVRPLSRRWNLEFELGLGVVWADWERYRCVNCGKRTGKGSGVYVTPTRTAVNLVYLSETILSVETRYKKLNDE